MVNRGDFEGAGDSRVCEQQQGNAIGATRNSEADRGVRLDQRPMGSGETLRFGD